MRCPWSVHRGPFFVLFDWSAIHRPHVDVYWLDEQHLATRLKWGDEYGDPVWAIDVEVKIPRWFDRALAAWVRRRA